MRKRILTEMTVVDLLRERASEYGDSCAYTFLEDGAAPGATTTYGSLDQRSRALAARLQEISRPGDRAILLFPAGLDFLDGLFGCLYAAVVAIPTPPPEASRLKRTGPRLTAIAVDAKATIVVTTQKIRDLIERAESPSFGGEPIRWIVTDVEDGSSGRSWRESRLSGDSLAYLQYTSGSTSSPKGVMIGHRNLMFHMDQLQRVCGYSRDSVTVTWMPNFHDYGLVEGLLEPLFNATPCFLMSPFAFVKRPESWLRAITSHRGTHSQSPNFGYDLCVRRIRADQRVGLDLSSWRAAGNAAEMINPRVLAAFQEAFGPCGFRKSAMRPAYGLAEATLLVSSSPLTAEPVVARLQAAALEDHRVVEWAGDSEQIRDVASCGQVFPAARVEIVDPETRMPCPGDRVGEIWVKDVAVAQGYWRRPDETEHTFQANLGRTGEGPFLRTGDLGFLLRGQLFVAGRIKDLIIIRGANHHPQDIEWTAQGSHAALRPEAGAAFSVVIDGDEKLVVAQEVEREHVAGLRVDEVAAAVREAIAASHDLELFTLLLLSRGSLPKTASGKIQRKGCRGFFFHGGPQVLAQWVAPARNLAAVPKWLTGETVAASQSNDISGARSVHDVSAVPSDRNEQHSNRSPDAPADEHASRQRANDLIAWLREYGAKRINSRLMDERRSIPPYVILDFGNRGLLGMQVPESYGGLGLRHVDCLRVLEQLAAIDLTLASVVFLNGTNGIRPIQGYATSAVREQLLPRLASGRELASFALSEPVAGANVGGIASEARPDGLGGWRIRGIKRWNSSSWAGVVSVFVRLVDDAGRPGGLTGFVVRQGTPGLRIGPEALTMGLRGSVQNSLILENVSVGMSDMLGAPGRGMEVAEDALTIGRLCIAGVCLGGLKRCAQLLVRYGERRRVATGQLLSNPIVLATLGELTGLIDALESLKHEIAVRIDAGEAVPAEIPMAAKVIGSDGLNWAASQLMQLLGGRGYMENNLAPQILRDARVLSVGEGPNEPLTTQVGRKARHTDAISSYLERERYGSEVNAILKAAVPEIADRCLKHPHPFADRSTAQLWAEGLIGRVVCEALLLASIRKAHAQTPVPRLARALEWTQVRFERALRRARDGRPEDRLMPTPGEMSSLVEHYKASIGDVEQTLAGEEEEVDVFLRTDAGAGSAAETTTLPGQAFVRIDDEPSRVADTESEHTAPLTAEARRELLAQLLRRRLEAASTEGSNA
jgi:acyl-CoA synthetase (AMP-forming)/AMP-acid ligase II/alkylation response protein AidB-like acyl-CoA dehydrogenase